MEILRARSFGATQVLILKGRSLIQRGISQRSGVLVRVKH